MELRGPAVDGLGTGGALVVALHCLKPEDVQMVGVVMGRG